jgi:hypothetical protein
MAGSTPSTNADASLSSASAGEADVEDRLLGQPHRREAFRQFVLSGPTPIDPQLISHCNQRRHLAANPGQPAARRAADTEGRSGNR